MSFPEAFSAALRFGIPGSLVSLEPYGKGHVNLTFLCRWRQGAAAEGVEASAEAEASAASAGDAAADRLYILQRINRQVFKRPRDLMSNAKRVSDHFRLSLEREGAADIGRRCQSFLPSDSGDPWHEDASGEYWRCSPFIPGGVAMEPEDPSRRTLVPAPSSPTALEALGILGAAIGEFQRRVSDLPPPRLFETIPRFHDMGSRYLRFEEALEADPAGRVISAREEIAFFLSNRERGMTLARMVGQGLLPERICHNDAKMDNILVSQGDGGDNIAQRVCVIDLDTVMPGTVLFDFGDLVRSAASTAKEDEEDLAKVRFDSSRYAALLEGYLSEARGFLLPAEAALLPEAGRAMAQIMGLRFLTDYLDGDRYYRIDCPDHNLRRCRNQAALIKSMDEARDEMDRMTQRTLAPGS